MFDMVTIARPYGKAVFEIAIKHHTVTQWQSMLTFSTEVSRNEQITELLSARVSPKKLADIFIAVCGDQLDHLAKNLIRIMAENGRLGILPDVLKQFIDFRAARELLIEVKIISAYPLKEQQLTKISALMEKRLSRKIKLNCKIDKSIIAGIIIRAGYIVINSSARGRLARLADVLQS